MLSRAIQWENGLLMRAIVWQLGFHARHHFSCSTQNKSDSSCLQPSIKYAYESVLWSRKGYLFVTRTFKQIDHVLSIVFFVFLCLLLSSLPAYQLSPFFFWLLWTIVDNNCFFFIFNLLCEAGAQHKWLWSVKRKMPRIRLCFVYGFSISIFWKFVFIRMIFKKFDSHFCKTNLNKGKKNRKSSQQSGRKRKSKIINCFRLRLSKITLPNILAGHYHRQAFLNTVEYILYMWFVP